MPKKSFAFSIVLLLVPIGVITYQLVLQDIDNPIHAVETNITTGEASVVADVKNIPGAASETSRKITVRNKIVKKMITYHKGFFSLTPNFELSVNNQPVKQGQQIEIPVIDGKIDVTYAYDFMGHKKGKKTVIFEVPENKDALDITFSWQKDPRVSLENAKALDVKEIY